MRTSSRRRPANAPRRLIRPRRHPGAVRSSRSSLAARSFRRTPAAGTSRPVVATTGTTNQLTIAAQAALANSAPTPSPPGERVGEAASREHNPTAAGRWMMSREARRLGARRIDARALPRTGDPVDTRPCLWAGRGRLRNRRRATIDGRRELASAASRPSETTLSITGDLASTRRGRTSPKGRPGCDLNSGLP